MHSLVHKCKRPAKVRPDTETGLTPARRLQVLAKANQNIPLSSLFSDPDLRAAFWRAELDMPSRQLNRRQ